MRRIPLFWKIWIFSTIITFLVINGTAFVTIIGIPYMTRVQENNETEAKLTELTDSIKANGLNMDTLDTLSKTGYIVEVRKNSVIEYQTTGWVHSMLYYTYEDEQVWDGESMDVVTMIPIEYSEFSTLDPYYTEAYYGGYKELPIRVEGLKGEFSGFDYHEQLFAVDGDSYAVRLVNSSSYYSNKATTIRGAFYVEGDSLSLAIISLVVASFLSLFIAWLISRRVKNLEKVVMAMATMQEPERTDYKAGDELIQLENQIYKMYGQLRQAIRKLDDEVIYTKKLEEDKQLFMRGATHELKTPIMAMNSMIEGMINNIGNYQDHEQYLKKCYANLQKIQKTG